MERNDMPADEDVLNLDAAAKLLKRHRNTVRKYAEKGDVPGWKLGREWRFSKRKLLARIEGREQAAAT